ncbi:MAG: hypothetical protein LBO00_06025 [Zoogloeaceae bacterium]|jgi:hypothetical protein|nr:hypothetical protein [Zoogloeaceae bacterium]
MARRAHRIRILPDQRGAALLALFALLLLGGLFWFAHLAAGFNRAAVRDLLGDHALAEAKEALLGYAAAYPEIRLAGGRSAYVPGHLPCPDTGSSIDDKEKNPEDLNASGLQGTEAPTCGPKGVTAIGHFPWRSLGIPPPRDGYGECLWYAVSGSHKAHPKADLLNPDIPGQFEVQDGAGHILAGKAALERPVAILFAPGPPLAGQDRAANRQECRGNYDARQFLEALDGIDNATPNPGPEGITQVIAASADERFNDRLLWITRAELLARLEKRPQTEKDVFDADNAPTARALTQRAAACLARFGDNNAYRRLPWAAAIPLGRAAPNTFENDAFFDGKNRNGGRLPFLTSFSKKEMDVTWGAFKDCVPENKNAACRLLRSDNCPELLPVAGYPTPTDGESHMDSKDGWLDKWKDHLFYLVAPGFAPAQSPAADCALTPEDCLRVNGHLYAAILIYAGDPLPGQSRATPAERQDAANYLEGETATVIESGGQTLALSGNDRAACLALPDATEPYRLIPDCRMP